MIADLLYLTGLAAILAGIYLWLGLPAALIALGVILIYTAVRIEQTTGGDNEPAETDDSLTQSVYPGQ